MLRFIALRGERGIFTTQVKRYTCIQGLKLCSRAFTTIGQQTTNQNNYGHSKKHMYSL